ncbi:hypothetical protein HanRHA438_Chr15g0728761 [Helianthus annuus]|nr:hypothetical protein HanRHA438_Chr15g0728761 [Helianthus annuus]
MQVVKLRDRWCLEEEFSDRNKILPLVLPNRCHCNLIINLLNYRSFFLNRCRGKSNLLKWVI